MQKALLWQVSKPNSQKNSYIFGTLHLANDEAYSHVNIAESYIEKCHTYLAEMNLDFDRDRQQQMFLNADGQKLTSMLSAKKWAKYKEICRKAYNVDLEVMVDFSPFYVMSLLQYQYQIVSHNKPLDYHLWEFAISRSKVMGGLESFEDQVRIHSSIPLEFSLKMLDTSLRNVSINKSQFEQMCNYYRESDYQKIHRMARRQMGEIRRLMIYDRNISMVHKFISIAETSSIFASVGAAHLGGNEGMLALLKKSGWQIKQILH